MSVIAYKFQAPNGSYWYIRADDHRTLNYWRVKRKLIPLSDTEACIEAHGAVIEVDDGMPHDGSNPNPPECDPRC